MVSRGIHKVIFSGVIYCGHYGADLCYVSNVPGGVISGTPPEGA
jgi:hypothetical protein